MECTLVTLGFSRRKGGFTAQALLTVGIRFWWPVLLSSPALGGQTQRLQGHVPPLVARLRALGVVPKSQRLNLVIGLPLRDQQ